MTSSNQPMLLSFIAEAAPAIPVPVPAEGMPSWLTTLLAVSGGSLGMGIFNHFSERAKEKRRNLEAKEKQQSDENKETAKGDATVEKAKVQAKADLEGKYFDALEAERKTRADEIGTLRREFEQAKTTLGHEIRNLRNRLNLTQEIYHQLWNACTMLAMQCRIMRSRIKKAEGERFDESEFPMVEIEVFDPKKLFSRMTTDQFGGGDERKITGRIILQPSDNEK